MLIIVRSFLKRDNDCVLVITDDCVFVITDRYSRYTIAMDRPSRSLVNRFAPSSPALG